MILCLLLIRLFSSLISGPKYNISQLDQLNSELRPVLAKILRTELYSHYKTSLNQKCKFWPTTNLCSKTDCSVIKCDTTQGIWDYDNLSRVDKRVSLSKGAECKYTQLDFCLLEDEQASDSVLVNLLLNKERYTGYGDLSAHKVWDSIYKENCFVYMNDDTTVNKLDKMPQLKDTCSERLMFYQIISGMHSSISTHLCSEYYDSKSKQWVSNKKCYDERVGLFKDRIHNMYFNYAFVVRAVYRILPYLYTYKQCDSNIKVLIKHMHSVLKKYRNIFDEKQYFTTDKTNLKQQFKHHFRNISQIINCVECEKCKLWGKVQINGYGTALKILFSFDKKKITYNSYPDLLQRTEIVALVNTLGRLSHSIHMRHYFENENKWWKRWSSSVYWNKLIGFVNPNIKSLKDEL